MDAKIKSALPATFKAPSFLARLFQFFSRPLERTQSIKIVGAVSIGQRDRVCVMEIGESWLVVGSSSNGLTTLAHLNRGGSPLGIQPPLPQPQHAQVIPLDAQQRDELDAIMHKASAGKIEHLELPRATVVADGGSSAGIAAERLRQRPAMTEVEEAPAPSAPIEEPAAAEVVAAPPVITEADVPRDEDGFPDPLAAVTVEELKEQDEAASEPVIEEPVVKPMATPTSIAGFRVVDELEKPDSGKSFLSVYNQIKKGK